MHILESPDSQNTASTRRERGERKKDHVVISMSIQRRRHKQLTKKRTLGLPPWNSQWQNTHTYKT
jgi:hypothetical protein